MARDTEANTAVEFAMVGLPFFLIIFVTMEIGVIAYVQSSLDDVATSVSREIMIGRIQNRANATKLAGSKFREQIVCPKVSRLLRCDRLVVNVYRLSTSRAGADSYFHSDGSLKVSDVDGERVCPGGPGDLAYLQISYALPAITARLSPTVRNSKNVHVVAAGRPIKNEPFIGNKLGGDPCVW